MQIRIVKRIAHSTLHILLLLCATSLVAHAESSATPAPTSATTSPETTSNQPPEKTPIKVLLETTEGNIVLELNKEKAPLSVENFLRYVNDGFYEGVIFHRVIDGFMIQTGGFDVQMNRKQTRSTVKNEAKNGLKNDVGTIAMARTAVVDSATSQFFINLKNNDFLNHGVRDYGYAVFGKVVEGMDVVRKIGKAKTTQRGMMQNVPATPITIKSAKVITAK